MRHCPLNTTGILTLDDVRSLPMVAVEEILTSFLAYQCVGSNVVSVICDVFLNVVQLAIYDNPTEQFMYILLCSSIPYY